MESYLIVANQTLMSPQLVAVLVAAKRHGPCRFHLVVPATKVQDQLVYTEGSARAVARDRLAKGLAHLAESGIDATGEVGDHNPVLAVEDAMLGDHFDALIVSTLPGPMSRWTRQQLPDKMRRRSGLPVIHVEAVTDTAQWPLTERRESDRETTAAMTTPAVHATRAGFDLVRDALTDLSSTQSQTRVSILRRLEALQRTLDWHVRALGSPDGVLHQIAEDAPHLVNATRRVARNAEALDRRVASLIADLDDRSTEHSPRATLRDGEQQELTDLIIAFERHLHDGAQLVFEAYHVDVSGH
ncbi:MAG: hypothetical protein AB7V43_08270 [Acidimicrobiia bacterium]